MNHELILMSVFISVTVICLNPEKIKLCCSVDQKLCDKCKPPGNAMEPPSWPSLVVDTRGNLIPCHRFQCSPGKKAFWNVWVKCRDGFQKLVPFWSWSAVGKIPWFIKFLSSRLPLVRKTDSTCSRMYQLWLIGISIKTKLWKQTSLCDTIPLLWEDCVFL